MATLSASRRNSANSNPNTPRASISGSSVPRMSSLEEEKLLKKVENVGSIITDSFDENDENPPQHDKLLAEPEDEHDSTKSSEPDFESYNSHENGSLDLVKEEEEEEGTIIAGNVGDNYYPAENDVAKEVAKEESHPSTIVAELNGDHDKADENESPKEPQQPTRAPVEEPLPENTLATENQIHPPTKEDHQEEQILLTPDVDTTDDILTQLRQDLPNTEHSCRSKKEVRTRACSERSDSGISDCSTHTHVTSNSCNSTPLLGKKFQINEEGEYKLRNSFEEATYVSSTSISLKANKVVRKDSLRGSSEESDVSKGSEGVNEVRNGGGTRRLSGLLGSKIESFHVAASKSKPPQSSESLRRLPIYSSRSVQGTIKKFDHQKSPSVEESPPPSTLSHIILVTRTPELHRKTSKNKTHHHPSQSSSPVQCRRSESCRRSNNGDITNTTSGTITNTPTRNKNYQKITSTPKITVHRSPSDVGGGVTKLRTSKIDRLVQKLEKNGHQETSPGEGGVLSTASPTIRYRSPSPSLLRKTQAVINKEKCNSDIYRGRNNLDLSDGKNGVDGSPRTPKSKSRGNNNECFQKVSAFWNTPKT